MLKIFDRFTITNHILAAKCGDKGFVVGGDKLEIIGNKGKYSDNEIESAARK